MDAVQRKMKMNQSKRIEGRSVHVNQKKAVLKIEGMTCTNCEQRIERMLRKTKGIIDAKVSYTSETVEYTYDTNRISQSDVIKRIEDMDYKVVKHGESTPKSWSGTKVLGALIIIFSLYQVMKYFGITNLFYMFPEAQNNMDYSMLFILGVLTSIHCVAMCGGINLSQCMKPSSDSKDEGNGVEVLKASFLYNLGRVISYTVVGGLVGLLGNVISFSEGAKGSVQLIAGVFMMIMGLNMLNIFPWLRRFNLRMPKRFARRIYGKRDNKGALYIGLINGLMPCGPLQAMQLYSLSTGSLFKGAFAMFLFSLGTVPLMFGLGALSSVLSKRFTDKVMSIGAVLVIILGVSMFSSGLSLSGIVVSSGKTQTSDKARIENGVQIVESTLESGQYPVIEVQVGRPVKWIIRAEKGSINGCNNRIFIPEYGIEKKLQVGENIIEFTPTDEGTFAYSCWMGMIRSSVVVTKSSRK